MRYKDIDFNPQFKQSLELMENTSQNVFITGRAGTGKSTLLDYFRRTTKKTVAVLAPTGVAALNVEGQTIHSFFKFKPDITLSKIKKIVRDKKSVYHQINALIIDEISMARADLLDYMDKFLRLNRGKNMPFGGLQMIFFGDLYQLPPVVIYKEKKIFQTQYKTSYFFSAKALEKFPMEFIELEKVYRQKDENFINLLNAIRNNTATQKELDLLNERYAPQFDFSPHELYIYLTPTNDLAKEINENQLAKLKGKLYQEKGMAEGEFDKHSLPTDIDLLFKKEAQIMMLNNDPAGRWVNGTLGRIIKIEEEQGAPDVIFVKLTGGKVVQVLPHTWKVFRYYHSKTMNSLNSETIGSFTQYPLKLAWAITIHKSQGKTFNKAIIDLGRGTFAHGQLYVALSRCSSLQGMVLKKKIQKKHIFMDWRVMNFVTGYQYELSDKKMPLEEKVSFLENAIQKKSRVKIVYLKNKDEKSTRVIIPRYVGQLEYAGKKYLGLEAYCLTRQDNRVFRVDRILEMNEDK